MASVYIETTIPSCYFETRTAPKIVAWRNVTREWWDIHRHRYELATSRFVLEELADAPKAKARDALALVKELRILEEPPGLEEVVEYYRMHRLMPAEAGGDAYHLAMASLQHGVPAHLELPTFGQCQQDSPSVGAQRSSETASAGDHDAVDLDSGVTHASKNFRL